MVKLRSSCTALCAIADIAHLGHWPQVGASKQATLSIGEEVTGKCFLRRLLLLRTVHHRRASFFMPRGLEQPSGWGGSPDGGRPPRRREGQAEFRASDSLPLVTTRTTEQLDACEGCGVGCLVSPPPGCSASPGAWPNGTARPS